MGRVPDKIFAVIRGGLGNQMFQYAVARSLAHRFGCDLVLDCSYFRAQHDANQTERAFELGAFRIDAAIAGESELGPLSGSPFSGLRRYSLVRYFLRQLRLAESGRFVFNEKQFSFDPDLLAVKPPVVISGYWQSERYFEDISHIVRQDFRLQDALSPRGAALAGDIASEPVSASIHVRRGDYVHNRRIRGILGPCSLDYYERAIEQMDVLFPGVRYFAFSDDPDYVRQHFGFCKGLTVIDGDSENPAQDMTLMSMCRHHIIANSTFSWWGAWLSDADDKVVIAPQMWFSPEVSLTRDTSDLLPPGWIRMA